MDTKEKIILSAAEEFAQSGYNNATMRKISSRARINHAGINYHFNTKQELFRDTVKYLVERTGEIISEPVVNFSDREQIRAGVRKWVKSILANLYSENKLFRWKNNILFREMIEPSPASNVVLNEYVKPRMDVLKDFIAEALGEGAEDIQVLMIFFSMIAQCLFPQQNKLIVSLYTEVDFASKETVNFFEDYITDDICFHLGLN